MTGVDIWTAIALAIGRWKDAKILSNKEVDGGSDFVIELTRR